MILFPWQKRSAPKPAAEKLPLGYRVAFLYQQGSRDEQQDSFALVNHQDIVSQRRMGLLAVLADGMGGMQGGRLASDTAVRTLCEAFSADAPIEKPASWLEKESLQAGSHIFQLLGGQGGSTLVACLVHQEKLWYASAGDSFLYLMRDGELSRLNRLQTVLQRELLEQIRAGSTDPKAARQHPEAHALTGFLGMEGLEELDLLLAPLPLKAGDSLLLCSDGVGGVLEESELLYCLRQGRAEEVCAALQQRVCSKEVPYQDNFTAIVIQCEI